MPGASAGSSTSMSTDTYTGRSRTRAAIRSAARHADRVEFGRRQYLEAKLGVGREVERVIERPADADVHGRPRIEQALLRRTAEWGPQQLG
jgi:hypothetical protein